MVKIKGLDKLKTKLNKLLDDVSSTKEAKWFGESALKVIKERTRGKRKGVENGRLVKLKSVGKKYSLWRNRQKGTHPEMPRGVASAMTLKGGVLNSMTITNKSKSNVKLGWKTKRLRDIAEGNETGSYGRSPNPKNARPFFSLSIREIEKLMREYKARVNKKIRKI